MEIYHPTRSNTSQEKLTRLDHVKRSGQFFIGTEIDVDFLKPENYVPLWKWLIDVARAEDALDHAQA